MTPDLSKLPAAPWHVIYSDGCDEYGRGPCGLSIGPHEDDHADTFMFSDNFTAAAGVPDEVQEAFEFTALARSAYDVMMRRGWSVCRFNDGRWAVIPDTVEGSEATKALTGRASIANDPLTALVKGEDWYKQSIWYMKNVEGKGS